MYIHKYIYNNIKHIFLYIIYISFHILLSKYKENKMAETEEVYIFYIYIIKIHK